MNGLTPVAVVRPRKTTAEWVGAIIAACLNTAAIAWGSMILIPTFAPWHPGYWQLVAALLVVRSAQAPSPYTAWTQLAPKKAKR